jgi:hypothetical protein
MIKKKIKSTLNRIKRIFFDLFIINKFNKKNIFYLIYKNNYWGSKESVSGPGSDFKSTKNIRRELPSLISKYDIKNILDVPCGDFNWMKKVLNNLDIDYLGCDIVEELIYKNKNLYTKDKVKFSKLDLVKDKLPDSDLLICRALFYHLDFFSIDKILKNLEKANIKYILLTNCPKSDNHINKDIPIGQYRDLDLFKAPLYFPNNYLYKFEDVHNLDTAQIEQEMILWKKDDLINKLNLR